VLGIGIIALGIVALLSSREVDRVAVEASVYLAASDLRDRNRILRHLIIDHAWWDDAVQNLIIEPDPTWADAHIGGHLLEVFYGSLSLVVTGKDTLVYVSEDGERGVPGDYNQVVLKLVDVIAAARSSPVKTVEPTISFVDIDDTIYMSVAAVIAPSEKWFAEYGKLSHRPVLIILAPVDETFLQLISDNFVYRNARLLKPAATQPTPPANLSLFDVNEELVSTLVWEIDQPGLTMIKKFLPGGAVFLIVVVGCSALFFRVATSTNTHLQRQNERLTELSTELKNANTELEALSFMDSLTGVANRRKFDEAIDIEWRRCIRDKMPLSLVLVDVDAFKKFNDEYGHVEGDNCLRRIAGAISASSNRAADTVARYGGEEFAIILPGIVLSDAARIAETIRKSVNALGIRHDKSEVADHVTISMGVASMKPTQVGKSKDLFKNADQKLYQAKLAGRDKIIF